MRCDECKYWERIIEGSLVGECHRYPPQIEVDEAKEQDWLVSEFSDVLEDNWCGEFDAQAEANLADVPVGYIDWTLRVRNALKRRPDLKSLGQLENMSDENLLCIKQIGVGSFREIRRKIRDYRIEHNI